MRAQMGVNLNYPAGLPDNLEYIVRDGAGWREAPVSGNWSRCVHRVDGIAAVVRAGEAKTLPTSVEDAIDTMRTVRRYISRASVEVELPMVE
jgi:hypothetical protein